MIIVNHHLFLSLHNHFAIILRIITSFHSYCVLMIMGLIIDFIVYSQVETMKEGARS